ncbi:hypothetical protein SAMN06269185_1386 [Natronoarchaeum philippinense]|uniref:Uncharacterized protein n=1 Tax=Natronoarchaeum philippinense TaxID=558529 RepID=A0A285NQG1_NATPI|nr:hypothetical protein [Natronoarchaeum philippinense]SNZ11744.1 hypothetical protein SAMN06269185_1386 [Natronoarchaeum philippinense]
MSDSLLAEEAAEKIRTVSRTAIGDSLRSVTYFTRDDYDQLYLRNDLEQDADLTSFIGHEWYGFKTAQAAYEGTELGAYKYTIRAFDNGYLVRVTDEREGVFVTTDGLTMQDFENVATSIKEVLREQQ